MPVFSIPRKTPYFRHAMAKIITVAFAVAILLGTLLSTSQIPEISTNDKLAHFIAFVLLAIPLNTVARSFSIRLNMGFVLFGGAIEMIQPVVGRHGDWLDFFVDMIGVLVGMILARVIHLAIPQTD